LNEVNHLMSERLTLRKTGRFQEADAIRDTLLEKHGVLVYDKDRSWRTGASPRGSDGRWIKDKKRGGRGQPGGFGPNGHDYNLAADAGPSASSLSEQEIHELLAERLDCKLNRRYKEADAIQNELNEAGVYVNDGSKHWRADGQPFEGYSPRRYEQSSFSLGTDYIEEIQTLVGERAKAKAERLYTRADEIRDTLREQYDVSVDDRNQQWSVGGSFGNDKRNERTFSSFSMSPDSERPDDFDEVQRLVELRDTARADRDFDTADRIRDDLFERNIVIDDKRRQWSFGFCRSAEKLHGYSMAPGSMALEDHDEIQRLVDLRNEARSERNFDEADQIRDELRQRNVVINDRVRQWSVGHPEKTGAKGFELPFTRRGGGEISKENEDVIVSLLKDRDECKRDRHFQSADRIRDRLKDEFQVGIDDRNREWHQITACYLISADSASVAEDIRQLIQQKIDDRAQAKLDREYDLADEIRDELMKDFNVSIDDQIKEWSILSGLDKGGAAQVEEEDDTTKETSKAVSLEVEQDDEATAHEDLSALTVPELKEKLRDAGLPVSGKKSELVERLSA
jgi:cysteinyl-tRNA synthetase